MFQRLLKAIIGAWLSLGLAGVVFMVGHYAFAHANYEVCRDLALLNPETSEAEQYDALVQCAGQRTLDTFGVVIAITIIVLLGLSFYINVNLEARTG
jgi:cell division protein FtsW (lipid II flippase)